MLKEERRAKARIFTGPPNHIRNGTPHAMQIELTATPKQIDIKDVICRQCETAAIGQSGLGEPCFHCSRIPGHKTNNAADLLRRQAELEDAAKRTFVVIIGAVLIFLVLIGSGAIDTGGEPVPVLKEGGR